MKSVTIKDLAKILKLSSSTVSRALCDHSDINPTTKQKVLDAAKKYNYKPNQAAKSLQNKKSNTIGVIVPEIRNPFFSTVISGIEEVAYQEGYSVMVCQSAESSERELVNMKTLAANNVAGILMSPSLETKTADHINSFQLSGMTTVLFDRTMEDLKASSVIVDDFEGAYNAVSYLIEKGYKRIGHLTCNDTLYVSRVRKQGYLAALKDHNAEFSDDFIVPCGIYEENGVDGARELFSRRLNVDAVFAFNDPLAIGTIAYLREEGIKIPDEVGVLGFTNNPEAAIVHPALTTVNQPAFEIGQTSARLLLDTVLSGKPADEYQIITLKTELVIRNSC